MKSLDITCLTDNLFIVDCHGNIVHGNRLFIFGYVYLLRYCDYWVYLDDEDYLI